MGGLPHFEGLRYCGHKGHGERIESLIGLDQAMAFPRSYIYRNGPASWRVLWTTA